MCVDLWKGGVRRGRVQRCVKGRKEGVGKKGGGGYDGREMVGNHRGHTVYSTTTTTTTTTTIHTSLHKAPFVD